MRRFILSAAAVVAMTSGSWAAVVAGSDVCGELPNSKWSWQITSSSTTSGGETTTSMGPVSYNPTGNVGTADVTTTTSAVVQTTTTTCTAINPAGKVNADHSTTTTTEVEISPETTSTEKETVCNPGAALPNCPL